MTISLDKDSARYLPISQELEKQGIEHRRVEALNGRHVPNFLLKKFKMGRNYANEFPGTFGCFMSHVRAWEIVADSDFEHTLILEDDVVLSPRLAHFDVNATPDSYDIIFVNNRLCAHLREKDSPSQFFPFMEAIRRRPNGLSNPGADGYFLSRSGSRKLLKMLADGPISRHVDAFICMKSINQLALADIRGPKPMALQLKHAGPPAVEGEELVAFCFAPHLVAERIGTKSSRTSIDQELA
nr:glycosyltransferase family 25 protein [Falsiroseomonas frigidaquae]